MGGERNDVDDTGLSLRCGKCEEDEVGNIECHECAEQSPDDPQPQIGNEVVFHHDCLSDEIKNIDLFCDSCHISSTFRECYLANGGQHNSLFCFETT